MLFLGCGYSNKVVIICFTLLWCYFVEMDSLSDIADTLRARLRQQGLTQASLRQSAGIAQRTLTNVLSGEQDFKVSTLLALADRLGLEMLLIPKGAVVAVDAGGTAKPKIPTRVDIARRQLGEPR